MKNSLRVSLFAMLAAIILIVSFQGWWLWQTYKDQKRELRFRTGSMFRDNIRQIQTAKLFDTSSQFPGKGQLVNMMNNMRRRMKDSANMPEPQKMMLPRDKDSNGIIVISSTREGSKAKIDNWQNQIDAMLMHIDSAQQPITAKEVSDRYAQQLKKQNIALNFDVIRDTTVRPDTGPNFEKTEVTIGIRKPVTFRLNLENEPAYLLKKLGPQIIFSIFLIGLTIASFWLLYKNLLRQQKLTELKNDFINNITHELKTPIATVSVAIEALKNFNAMDNPERTREYLDISGNELSRLAMLVDKVLKMSMFEKNELVIKKEQIDSAALVREVVKSMQLQFEKEHANVTVNTSGTDFNITGDKLHITSVIYNLLDNALKYSGDEPVINVFVNDLGKDLELTVTDNGIGINKTYLTKIFDKFFRVPHGDTHNIKGYGLGLSYVAQVVKEHGGTMDVISEEGKGSSFKVIFKR